MTKRTAPKLFSALSNPTRLAIILSLAKGEKCVSDIVKELKIEQSVISHNLKPLVEARLIKQRRQARFTFFSLSERVYPLMKLLKGQDVLGKEVEASLNDNLLNLQKLAELIPLPVVIHRGVNVVYANRAANGLFRNGAPHRLIGKVLMDILPPEDKMKLMERQAKLRSGESLPPADYTVIRPDGSKVLVEANMVLVRIDGGYGFFTVARDVTAEREFARRQQEAAARYKGILEATSYGILVLGRDDRIAYINPSLAAMIDAKPEDIIGKKPGDLMTDETMEVISRKLKERRSGVSETYDLDMEFRDGHILKTTCTSNPILDKEGHYDGLVNIVLSTRGNGPSGKK